MSKAPYPRPISWLRTVTFFVVIAAAIVAIVLGAFQLIDNAVRPDGIGDSSPTVAAQAQTCRQLVPKTVAIDLGGATIRVTPSSSGQVSVTTSVTNAIAIYPTHGYCAVAVSRIPWVASHISSLPTRSAICVVYDQTPDRTVVSDRDIALLSAGTSFTVDTVHGVFADGTSFVATPVAVVIFVALNGPVQPRMLPDDVLGLLRQFQPQAAVAATSATSPIFGVPAYATTQEALQVPGWK